MALTESLAGTRVAVGAPYDDARAQSGSADVLAGSGAAWVVESKVTGSNTAFQDSFGCAVDISEDRLAVGAYLASAMVSDSGHASTASAFATLKIRAAPS